jgi:hypothetical protein
MTIDGLLRYGTVRFKKSDKQGFPSVSWSIIRDLSATLAAEPVKLGFWSVLG